MASAQEVSVSDTSLRRRLAHRLFRPAPDPTSPDLDYLFVVTYGRSGSTLLQGVLNSIPGYLIRGENRQALRHLWEFHRTAVEERRRQRRSQLSHGLEPGSHTATNAFYGIDEFPVRRSLSGIRRLALDTILRPEPDTRVTGFKEVRWLEEDVAAYVEWLQRVFPGARFVINTRNLDDVSQSKWWAGNPDAHEVLRAVETRLLALAESLGEAGFRVHYDDYVADPSRLRPLFEWLGEEYDESRVRAVMETPHSY
jgi:hypothetical protein